MKYKQLPRPTYFVVFIVQQKRTFVQYLVKYELLHLSQNDEFLPILADNGIDQYSIQTLTQVKIYLLNQYTRFSPVNDTFAFKFCNNNSKA